VESSYDSCVLVVADRVVARADAGPLDAEFALFDAEAIELKTTEPGAVREVGYRTTVREARERMVEVGMTPEIVEAAAEAIRPVIAPAYARGPVVRRAIQHLGAAELFEGRVYLASARAYEGQWLDLSALSFDMGEADVARVLQAMHLAALLEDLPSDAEVVLTTLALTRTQRPGVRTYRRVTFRDAEHWPMRLLQFAEHVAPGTLREGGPTRVEMLDWLGARSARATESARERAARIEQAIAGSPRPPPPKGPLSDPVAWSIEAQLDAGDAQGAIRRIDGLEREHGSIPSVVYLRSRASLILQQEDPLLIAERVSMLAAKSSFDELELLAAQAWAAAGNMGRALPFARVVATNPRAHDELRTRARRLVELAESKRPSVPARRLETPTPSMGFSSPPTSGARERRTPSRGPSRPSAPRYHSPLPAVLAPPSSGVPATRNITVRPTEASDQRLIETMPPPPSPPPVDGDSEAIALSVSSELEVIDGPALEKSGERRSLKKGISRPAFRAVSNDATPPSLAIGRLESAERLEDPTPPPSLADARVRAAHEARLRCTALSRELGKLYRMQHGIELRTDVGSIEAMQSELLSRYQNTGVKTAAATADVERHGAFLSELLARTLRATWADVSPQELGHWTMFVPPDTRVWPFARVLRFVTMGSRERDLVAYFLELHARSC